VQWCDEVVVAVFDFTRPEIARVSTVTDPDDRVEVREAPDIVSEVIELWALVGVALCDSCDKQMFVFTVHPRSTVKFNSAIVCFDLVGLLVVPDELV